MAIEFEKVAKKKDVIEHFKWAREKKFTYNKAMRDILGVATINDVGTIKYIMEYYLKHSPENMRMDEKFLDSCGISALRYVMFVLNNGDSASWLRKRRETYFPFLTDEILTSGDDFLLDLFEFCGMVKPEYVKLIRKQKPKIRHSLIKSMNYSTGYLTAFKIRLGNMVQEANKYPKLYSNDKIIDMVMDLRELKPKYYREAFYILEDLESDELRIKLYKRIFKKLRNKSSMKSFLTECRGYMGRAKSDPLRIEAIQKGLAVAMEFDEGWEEKIFEFKLNGDI